MNSLSFSCFAGPAGVLSPTVKIIGPTVMNVSWVEPLQPNGLLEFYTIRLPEPHKDVRNVSIHWVMFEDLIPYTEYAVTVTACTSVYKHVIFIHEKIINFWKCYIFRCKITNYIFLNTCFLNLGYYV